MFTSRLMNRIGITITKVIHRKIEMSGNWISLASSLSPLGDWRKTVSKLKSPAVIDVIFSIVVGRVKNGDRYRKQKYTLHNINIKTSRQLLINAKNKSKSGCCWCGGFSVGLCTNERKTAFHEWLTWNCSSENVMWKVIANVLNRSRERMITFRKVIKIFPNMIM